MLCRDWTAARNFKDVAPARSPNVDSRYVVSLQHLSTSRIPSCAGRLYKITTFIGVASSLGRSGPWKSPSPLASSPTPLRPTPPSIPTMSDDKKRDYTVELGDRQPNGHYDAPHRPPPPTMQQNPVVIAKVADNPLISILTYCGSSILMTVANKYVVSGTNFNLNFFLLFVQVGHTFARIHPELPY